MWRALACLGLAVLACSGGPTHFATVCDQATDVIERCGATVPLLQREPCTGLPRFISQCVAAQVHGCDELATLARDPSRCLFDGGEAPFPEAESLPFPAPDHVDGGSP
jgi:hypothetical protein